MGPQGDEPRLATTLVADMVDQGRIMEVDAVGTPLPLNMHRKDLPTSRPQGIRDGRVS